MQTLLTAQCFPPGEFIKEELAARGWSHAQFAAMIDQDPASVADLLDARRCMTAELAAAIGGALGTDAQVWLNLEASYQGFKARRGHADRSPG